MRNCFVHSALVIALAACMPLAFAAAPPPASTAPATSAAPQWPNHHGPSMRGHGMGMGMWDQLDLSDTQRASIRQLRQQGFQQARPRMQALRQQRMALDNATPGSANYQTAANALAEAEANAARARVLSEADLRSRIYNVLTPAQRAKLASLREQRQAKMRQWREAHMQHQVAPASATAAPDASSN